MALLICAACAGAPPAVDPEVSLGVLDFREHTADGFFLSPDAYALPHTVLALVAVDVYAGATRRANETRVGQHWLLTSVSVDSAVALAKQSVRALGGDGLVNLEIDADVKRIVGYPPLPGWRVRGLAIRREAPPPAR